MKQTLSIIVPCYNEEVTLESCINEVLQIQDDLLQLQIIIVDDCSRDKSREIAKGLSEKHKEVIVLHHDKNQGKGAAIRTGIKGATGDFVAIQDADREYDPNDLKRLLVPLIAGKADAVFGSRFLSQGVHRVLYYWHSVGNRLLTWVSNMMTDLNLTDMETCYKVFRKEVIQKVEIEENRFGFEPEIVAKIAKMRVRIYEMGISYYGRTYAEGKKIGLKDAFRAIYCIVKYNKGSVPIPIQFVMYLLIGGIAAGINVLIFLPLFIYSHSLYISTPIAFSLAAIANYLLGLVLVFRHRVKWNSAMEIIIFSAVVVIVGTVDLFLTKTMMELGVSAFCSKVVSSALCLLLNFLGRRIFVFPERVLPDWK